MPASLRWWCGDQDQAAPDGVSRRREGSGSRGGLTQDVGINVGGPWVTK